MTARTIILVEGDSDRRALQAVAGRLGHALEPDRVPGPLTAVLDHVTDHDGRARW